ncbi:AP-4 complex accessory subunit tepsin isoform X1 [Alligator mississippiensis]|uniref:AP-4 complex accessory subunit tepsin isoform X1 n=1 Tax=Alligator mississippiensis TaxID=8496 RepID=UPI0028774A7B|nr:AP-4 complex accessory subunit tepsin isoform X1 [Alligator mississippiensis]
MAAPLRDRLSFLSRLPTLIKSTSDDDAPCPGYLFEEIAKISHESPGSSQCLLEHLLARLHSRSCHVKLKVLKILLYMCTHGSSPFLLQLKRNSTFIQEAAAFAGPPDPLHGNSLYQQVRAAAQDLASALFSDTLLPQPSAAPARLPAPAGMGASSSPCSSLQGFGFTREQGSSASPGEALLSTIQKAAEVVASAVLPRQDPCRPRSRELQDDAYQPVTAPSPGRSYAGSEKPLAPAAHGMRVSHQPGQPGGGWEETDSRRSSQDSSQENGELSRTSDSYSKSGSDSHSGASRELGGITERTQRWSWHLHPRCRVEADNRGDCLQEVSLVSGLAHGPKVFLTREEVQHFIKECGLLNCEVVLELLNRTLQDPSACACMRAMCAISALMCSDLLAPDQIFLMTRQHLQQLSQGSPGPVANKATKILRQFEALCSSRTTPASCPLDLAAPAGGPAQCTQDLLTDTVPLAGERVLQPISLAPLPLGAWEAPDLDPPLSATPACLGQLKAGAETCEQAGDAVIVGPCQQEVACRLAGAQPAEDGAHMDPGHTHTPSGAGAASMPLLGLSLFAGMELVAPSDAALATGGEPAVVAPWRPPHAGDQGDPAGNLEPSVFSFLNM